MSNQQKNEAVVHGRGWRQLALVAAALVAGVLGGGLALDPDSHLEVGRELRASRPAVYAVCTRFEGMQAWWAAVRAEQNVPPFVLEHVGGPPEGVGMVVQFKTGDLVVETWVLLEVTPDERVLFEVDFAGLMKTRRLLTLTETPRGTQVAWREDAHFSNPVFRWATLWGPAGVLENIGHFLSALEQVASRTP